MDKFLFKIQPLLDKFIRRDISAGKKYGGAILVVLLVLFSEYVFSIYSIRFPSLLTILPVVLVAFFGGFGPGILATVLMAILEYFFFFSTHYPLFTPGAFMFFLINFLEGFLVSLMAGAERLAVMGKSEMMSFASHEIRNPLATIQGYSDLLRMRAKKEDDEKGEEFALKIRGQVLKITDLLHDLTEFTRIDAGLLVCNFENFRIYPVVYDLFQQEKERYKTHQLVLTGMTKKIVYGDKERISQALASVISNAVKYSSEGKKVTIKIEDLDSKVLISVRDQGIGIPMMSQKKILKKFYRGTRAERGIKGSGLGLFITEKIIRKHKGKISLISKVGKGSTFFVALPSKA